MARSQWIHGDSLTHAQFCHTSASLDDFSGNFMAEHQGFADFKIQNPAFMVIVQVGAANSSCTEPHQDLVILRVRRCGAILNLEIVGSMDNTSDHRDFFGVTSGREYQPYSTYFAI